MSESKRITDPTAIRRIRANFLAPMILAGKSARSISEELKSNPETSAELKMSYQTILLVLKSSEYADAVKSLTDEHFSGIIAEAKSHISRLVPKAIKAIERALDEGTHTDGLQAARMVFRSVGLEEGEEKTADQNITVIMPGATTEQVIEVKADS